MSDTSVITPAQFLAHWQGHRRVTKRTIAAFPEDLPRDVLAAVFEGAS